MNIDELTLGDLKKLKNIVGGNCESDCPWEIGKNYFIRTVTMHHTGRLVAVTQQELVLEDAAWIADSGRFSDALADTDNLKEVEPFPTGRVIIGRGAVIDAAGIGKLPREKK